MRVRLLLAVLLLAMLALAFAAAGRLLRVADPLAAAAAVVPLAGERGRPLTAAELLLGGYAERLAITRLPLEPESYRDWYVRDVARSVIERGVPPEAVIDVPGVAPSTYRELENVRDFALSEGWDSLLLVTSEWHTRRSRAIARRVFRGTGVSVSVRPSPEHRFSLGWDWWRSDLGRQTVVSEYLKMVALLIGVR